MLELGAGKYGVVTRDGNTAVKKFKNETFLIREYCAAMIFKRVPRIIQAEKVSLQNLTITYELCDTDLKSFIMKSPKPSKENRMKIIAQLVEGLSEIHERGFSHGDFKLDNILIKNGDVVIADLGMTGPHKYARIHNTAPMYRRKKIVRDGRHDFFGLKVMIFEIYDWFHFSSMKSIAFYEQNWLTEKPPRNNFTKMMDLLIRDKITSTRELREFLGIRAPIIYQSKLSFKTQNDVKIFPGGRCLSDVLRDVPQGVKAEMFLENYFSGNHVPSSWVVVLIAILQKLFGSKKLGRIGRKYEHVFKAITKDPSFPGLMEVS